MLQNTLANLAMQRSQEQNQNDRFKQQVANNDFGKDHLGNAVNQQQRQDWNNQLTDFRANNGAGATSQNLFDNLQGRPFADAIPSFGGGGADMMADRGGFNAIGEGGKMGAYDSRDMMAQDGPLDPYGKGFGSKIGRGLQGIEDRVVSNYVKASSFADRVGNAYRGLVGGGRGGGLGSARDGSDNESGMGGLGGMGGMGQSDDNDGNDGFNW